MNAASGKQLYQLCLHPPRGLSGFGEGGKPASIYRCGEPSGEALLPPLVSLLLIPPALRTRTHTPKRLLAVPTSQPSRSAPSPASDACKEGAGAPPPPPSGFHCARPARVAPREARVPPPATRRPECSRNTYSPRRALSPNAKAELQLGGLLPGLVFRRRLRILPRMACAVAPLLLSGLNPLWSSSANPAARAAASRSPASLCTAAQESQRNSRFPCWMEPPCAGARRKPRPV